MSSIPTLADLGWSAHFLAQLSLSEIETLHPMRIAAVGRDRATGLNEAGSHPLLFPPGLPAGALAVGDWVLVTPDKGRIERVLDRRTELARSAPGNPPRRQLIAANLDALFVTTACNAEFNPARLERYLALAFEGGIVPVIVLTRTDLAADTAGYLARARAISARAEAVGLDARDPAQVAALRRWCGPGQSVALVGSSGVGKSTLAAALTGTARAVAAIRAHDAHGRHTTTARSLIAVAGGGWLIDTPGMREIGLFDASGGIEAVFPDIPLLAEACRFRDCRHESEPGCAVRAAVDDGRLDPARLARWRKLMREDAAQTATIAQSRKAGRDFARVVRRVKADKARRRDPD